MMKKTVFFSISLCLLFATLLVPVQADEKDLPQSYQCTFKVGSVDFHGVVDGIEGTGALLYPIYIDETCGRAGISFFVPFPPPGILDSHIIHSLNPEEFTMIYGYSQETRLYLHYPSQKAYINDEEIPNLFPMKRVREGVNPDAHWNGALVSPGANSSFIAPLRLVFEFTGHEVDWNPDTQEITITYPAPEAKE
jgi:hypothetical protein